jgi:hypothetical protein
LFPKIFGWKLEVNPSGVGTNVFFNTTGVTVAIGGSALRADTDQIYVDILEIV